MTKNQPHLLIVDDDNRILKLLKKFLSQNGFFVSTSTSPKEALSTLEKFTFDLIILDVMMPEITGIEFAKAIKDSGKKMPVVMLTALSEPDDRVRGLEAGASDYVTKPFEPRELLLRINNLLNLHTIKAEEEQTIRMGRCKYNLATKELRINDEPVKLSTSEQNLLDVMISNRNEPITREDLGEALGGLNPRSVDVQVVRLRNKIEVDPKAPEFLKTIRNHGYVLRTS